MKKYFLIASLSIIMLSGCSHKIATTGTAGVTEDSNCAAACANIPFSTSAPEITASDLEKGWYWGSLNQKKKGTPDTWIHVLEGTRSAAWKSPENASGSKCDCVIKKD